MKVVKVLSNVAFFLLNQLSQVEENFALIIISVLLSISN